MHKYKIYFAGPLFDIKDLSGNLLLSQEIKKQSEGVFECLLPQDIIVENPTPKNIRNSDFKALISSDMALFNFDGTDLDSGTVAEFMTAKFLSIPSVIIRSDFRKSGDQDQGGENWNLMCSFYPQTKSISVNSILEYQNHLKKHDAALAATLLNKDTAEKIIKCFSDLLGEEMVIKRAEAKDVYADVIEKLGGDLNLCCDEEFVENIIEQKAFKGLLA